MALQTYKAIKPDGSEIIVTAADPNAAILTAGQAGADPRSGVMRYTPSVAYPTPTPPSSPTTPTTPVPSPYAPAPTDSSYGRDVDAYRSVYDPEEQAARRAAIDQEAARQRQARIDAINTIYNQRNIEDRRLGKIKLDEQRALNFRSGIVGSDFGVAAKQEVRETTEDKIKGNEALRSEAISKALQEIDAFAEEKFKNRETLLQQSTEARYKIAQDRQTQALNRLATIAKATPGLTLARIKAEDQKLYEDMRNLTGMSDLELDSVLAANVPEQFKPISNSYYSPDSSGNAVLVRVTVDPLKKTSEKYETPLGIPYSAVSTDKPLEMADGRYMIKDPNSPDGYKFIGDVSAKYTAEVNNLNAQAAKNWADANNKGDSGYVIPKTNRNNLLKLGLKDIELDNLQANIRDYGIQAALNGIKDASLREKIGTELDKNYYLYAQ